MRPGRNRTKPESNCQIKVEDIVFWGHWTRGKQEGKEIVKSILDDDFAVNSNKNKEEYVDFDNKKQKNKNIVDQIKKEGDDDFFKFQNKDGTKNEFDEGGFEFDENAQKPSEKKKEDIFGLGFVWNSKIFIILIN